MSRPGEKCPDPMHWGLQPLDVAPEKSHHSCMETLMIHVCLLTYSAGLTCLNMFFTKSQSSSLVVNLHEISKFCIILVTYSSQRSCQLAEVVNTFRKNLSTKISTVAKVHTDVTNVSKEFARTDIKRHLVPLGLYL